MVRALLARFVFFAFLAALAGYVCVYACDLARPPIRSDGFSYYVYLPSWFLYRDVTMETLAADCCAGTFPAFSGIFRLPETGRWVNPHPIGEALLLAPFFLVADALTRWSNLPREGFSIYYQYVIGLAGACYFAAGLALLRRTLQRKFSDGVTLATLAAITWGTNLFHYATYDSVFSHVFSFFLFAALLEITMAWTNTPTRWKAVLAGLVAGLVILVRHTNGLMLLFPIGYALSSSRLRERWKDVLLAGIVLAVVLLPQVMIYRHASGQWLFSPYGPNGHFDFAHPQILEVLFGVKKGLFFWSPLLLLGVAGLPLVPKHFPGLLLPALIVLPLTLLLVASWSDWQMGGSLGHRGFTDLLPIFAIGLAAFFERAAARRWTPVVAIAVSAVVMLSAAQMVQYWLRIIPFSDTSWALYKSVFLKFH